MALWSLSPAPLVLTLGAGLLLTACADRYDADAVADLPAQGEAFTAALRDEYVTVAAAEQAESDWYDSANFLRRARRAAGGEVVPPAPPPDPALGLRRQALVAALDGGARANQPALAARAQAEYDCSAHETEEAVHLDPDPHGCRARLEASLGQLRAALAPADPPPETVPAPAVTLPQAYVLFFNHGSAALTEGAAMIVGEAARAARQGGDGRVQVLGHADTSGPGVYNLTLSQARAETVADALTAQGVAPARLALEACGEERPEVPTADGIREVRNRRVEIRLLP